MQKLHSFSPFIKNNNNKESIILLVKKTFPQGAIDQLLITQSAPEL